MEHPLITGGGHVVRRHRLGNHSVVLMQEPNSIPPITYRYVMIVFPDQGKEPVMFVTSEQNTMQADLFKIARQSLDDPSLEHDPHKWFLGVFDENGRQNLGGSRKWGGRIEFEERALQIVRAKLGIPEPRATSAPDSNPKTSTNPEQHEVSDAMRVLMEEVSETDEEKEPLYIAKSVVALVLSIVLFFVFSIIGVVVGRFVGRELFFIEIIVPGAAAFLAPGFAVSIVKEQYHPHIVGLGFLLCAVSLAIVYAVLVLPLPSVVGVSGFEKLAGMAQVVAIAAGAALSYRALVRP